MNHPASVSVNIVLRAEQFRQAMRRATEQIEILGRAMRRGETRVDSARRRGVDRMMLVRERRAQRRARRQPASPSIRVPVRMTCGKV